MNLACVPTDGHLIYLHKKCFDVNQHVSANWSDLTSTFGLTEYFGFAARAVAYAIGQRNSCNNRKILLKEKVASQINMKMSLLLALTTELRNLLSRIFQKIHLVFRSLSMIARVTGSNHDDAQIFHVFARSFDPCHTHRHTYRPFVGLPYSTFSVI